MEKPKRDKFKSGVRGRWLRRLLIGCIFCGLMILILLMSFPICGCTPPMPKVDFDNLPCTPQDIPPSAEHEAWQNAHFAICATATTVSKGEQVILVAQPINVHRNYPDQCVTTELVQNPTIFRTGMQIRDCTGAAIYVLEAVQQGITEVYFFSPQVVMYPPEISFSGTDDVYSASLNITVIE